MAFDFGTFEGASGDERGGTQPYFVDTYLDSPVLTTTRSSFLSSASAIYEKYEGFPDSIPSSDMKKLSLPQKKAWNVMKLAGNPLEYEILDPDEYADFYSWQLKGAPISDVISEPMMVATTIYQATRKAIDTWLARPGPPAPGRPCVVPDNSPLDFPMDATAAESLYYARMYGWNRIISTVEARCSESKPYAITVDLGAGGKVHTNWEVALVDLTLTDGRRQKRLLTWDQMLMVKDLNYSRAQVSTALRVFYPKNDDLHRAVSRLYAWHEKCLTRYLNPGFGILKQSESLAKAYLSVVSGDIFGEDGPFRRMVEKVKDKERGLGATAESGFLADEFESLLRDGLDIASVVEIFGLQKVSGHPMIDPILGGLSAAKEARDEDGTTRESAQRIDWNFKRIFLESYVPVKGWPALQFSDKTTELYRLCSLQKRDLHRNSYPLSDWKSCTFPRIFEFDFAPNYLELMDDKSISFYRSNIRANWMSPEHQKSQRRLLLEMISREEVSARAIVYMVMRREIPLDWLIVSLYPKEREFKIEPRMFSMLVFEMRLYFTLLESNLADNVFKYLPQQTMTKSRLETGKILLEMTKPVKLDHMINLFLEVDLSRWNLRWRQLTVHTVGETLDDMFGLPGVYTFVHWFFSHCMICVRVADLEPPGLDLDNPPESDLLWYDHKGGFEGLSQKHWTICTYSMVDLALYDLPVSYRLIGQGDNQIISLRFARDPDILEKEHLIQMRDTVLFRIQNECSRTNQIVKPEECLESTTVLTYSKDVYVNGVYYPTSLKFHSRLFPHSSQDFPSIRTNVGAIFSTAISGAEKNANPLTSYYLALVQACQYLYGVFRGHGTYGKWAHEKVRQLTVLQTRSLVTFLLTLPSDLGGYPIAPFTAFFYKGGSDPLGKGIASLVLLRNARVDLMYDRILSQMDTREIYADNIAVMSLIRDPYSIPLSKPVTPIDGVTKMTIGKLRPRIMTKAIEQLLSDEAAKYGEDLAAILGDVRPFNPLLLRDILECSVYGIADTIGKMFVATRTIQAIVRGGSAEIIMRVLHLEREGLSYLFKRFSTLPTHPWQPRSIRELCITYRHRWEEYGVPSPEGITTYSPFDFRYRCGLEVLEVDGIHAIMTTDPRTAVSTRGPFDPYVGGKTREKRSEHGYKIVSSDTTSEAFRKLQLISSQTGNDPTFQRLLDVVGLSRSNTLLSTISGLLPSVTGGTLSHRYAARAGYQESFNMGSPNVATHCAVSTDRSGQITGGGVEVMIMLQEFLLTAIVVLTITADQSDPARRALVLLTSEVELDEIPSEVVTLHTGKEIPFMSFSGNPLAFVDSLRIERLSSGAGLLRPLKHSRLHDTITVTSRDDQRIIAEGWFRDLLREGNTARLIADGATQTFSVQRMDIAEVVSNGLELLATAAAAALADSYLLDSFRTVDRSRERWNLMAYLTRVASPLATSISSFIGHHLLRNDPLVRSNHLYDAPGYVAEGNRPDSRLRGIIASRAADMILRGDYNYYRRTIGLFSAADGTRDLEIVLGTVARALCWATRTNSITIGARLHIVDKYILPVLRDAVDGASKLAMLDVVLKDVTILLRRANAHQASELVGDIYYGKVIRLFRISAQEAMRLTRLVVTEGDLILPTHAKVRRARFGTIPLRPVEYITQEGSQIGVRATLSAGEGWDTRLPSLSDRIVARVGWRIGEAYYTSSRSLVIWDMFGALFQDKTVLVVGAGVGYVATSALRAGAVHVHGLDLQESIPIRPHRFVQYVPPLVAEHGLEASYTHSPLSFLTDGSWFNPVTSSAFLALDPGDATIVIDIESGWSGHPLSLLHPLARSQFKGIAVIRCFLSDGQVMRTISDLLHSKYKFRLYSVGMRAVTTAYILVVSNIVGSPRFGPSVISAVTLNNNMDLLEAGREIRATFHIDSDIVMNSIDVSVCTSLSEVHAMLEWYYTSLIGKYEGRLSFRQWTTVLRALLAITWLQLPAGSHLPTLLEWASSGVATITVGGRRVEAHFDQSFLNYILQDVVPYLPAQQAGK